jgi:hypothetical protein
MRRASASSDANVAATTRPTTANRPIRAAHEGERLLKDFKRASDMTEIPFKTMS